MSTMAAAGLSKVMIGEPMFLGRKARTLIERSYMCLGAALFLGLLAAMVASSPEGSRALGCILGLGGLYFLAMSRIVWNLQRRLSVEDRFAR